MRFWKYVFYILILCFSVSLITLVVLFAENNFSDETLFILLTILRYSTFLVFLSAAFMVIECVSRIIKRGVTKDSLRPLAGLAMSVFCLLYGAVLFIMDVFLTAISKGNL